MAVDSVAVIGLGYIGLPTAVMLARSGMDVIGVDLSRERVEAVRSGVLPFVEPGLGDALAEVVSSGKLTAQMTTPRADAYIVATPTPFKGKKDHNADLSYIESAGEAIAAQLRGGELVVLESTSPPGTTEHLAEIILKTRPDFSLDGSAGTSMIHFAHAPERVLPGRMMVELVENDRIVGGVTDRAAIMCRELYATFCRGTIAVTDARTAEMSKLTENAFRDVNIAFANELSLLCDRLNIDVWELIELANMHPRVNILEPGPGVGGHCIAVDPWFIVSAAPDLANLLKAARNVNDSKPKFVMKQVEETAANFDRPVIAALGAAFKPDVDDVRGSPAVRIVNKLAKRLPQAQFLVVDPNVRELPDRLARNDNVAKEDLNRALMAADIVLLMVDHREFREIDRDQLEGKAVIDTRGIWRD